MQLIRALLAMCTFGLAVTSWAEVRSMDQYRSIVERNPFGLKDRPPPPPPVTNAVVKPDKKEDFYLTGISTIGDSKRPKAYLLCKDAGKKEYDQKYYNLSVGDRQGDLALLDVDPKARRVKVAYMGEERSLSMNDNGVPAPSGPVPAVLGPPNQMSGGPNFVAAPHSAVPLVNGTTMTPGGASTPQPVIYPNSGMRRTPRSTSIYSPGGVSGVAPGAYSNGFQGNSSLPTGNGAPAAPPEIAQGPQTDEDVARQIINMHANYQNSVKQGEMTPPVPLP